MPLVSKDNTYNENAFEEKWWKDHRMGFDPPEAKAAQEREKEWHKQFQKQQPSIAEEWAQYEREREPDGAEDPRTDTLPKVGSNETRKRSGSTIGGFLSSAMKPNFKRLVRHGIPSEKRAKIWFEKSGAMKKKNSNPGVYAKYVAEVKADAHEDIQMDIARTFSMHLLFATYHTKTMMLRILSAFTVRNPSYGYCQNMTFIVALILFFLPEEDAFWLFVTIIEDILPVDFCSPTLIGLRVDQKILDVLLKERLPKLHAHFTAHNVDLSCFSTAWLLKLFVNVFPIQTTLRVWDCFLIEGSKILFRVALAFLKMHEDQVKRCNDSGELMTFLTTECKQFYDADRLIKACGSFWALRRKQINELRTKFIEQELAENPHIQITAPQGGQESPNSSSEDEAKETEHKDGATTTPA